MVVRTRQVPLWFPWMLVPLSAVAGQVDDQSSGALVRLKVCIGWGLVGIAAVGGICAASEFWTGAAFCAGLLAIFFLEVVPTLVGLRRLIEATAENA